MLTDSNYWYIQTEAAGLQEAVGGLDKAQCMTLATACATHATNRIAADARAKTYMPDKLIQIIPWIILQRDFWHRHGDGLDAAAIEWIGNRTVEVFESVYLLPDESLTWPAAEMISWATLGSLTIGNPKSGDKTKAAYNSLYRSYKAVFFQFSDAPEAYGQPNMIEAEHRCAECLEELAWQLTCVDRVKFNAINASEFV